MFMILIQKLIIKNKALEKVKISYENGEIEGVFVADATTIENTKFKVADPK